jgi:hypothetical protein
VGETEVSGDFPSTTGADSVTGTEGGEVAVGACPAGPPPLGADFGAPEWGAAFGRRVGTALTGAFGARVGGRQAGTALTGAVGDRAGALDDVSRGACGAWLGVSRGTLGADNGAPPPSLGATNVVGAFGRT